MWHYWPCMYTTIKLYLSALRLYHIEHNFEDPTKDCLLQYVVKGTRRDQCTPARPRLPVTIQILCDLKVALHHSSSLTTHDKRMLWAAFCVAFYGFLRASELCAPSTSSFDPSTTLYQADINLTHSTAHILIKASKPNTFCPTCTTPAVQHTHPLAPWPFYKNTYLSAPTTHPSPFSHLRMALTLLVQPSHLTSALSSQLLA